MNRFQAILQRTHDRLHLPRATRSRILLEMAADLEGLFQHYLDEGLDEAEASHRAEDAFAVSDAALERLLAVHRPGLDRLSERLAVHLAGGWEKVFLGVLVTFAVLMALLPAVASGDFLAGASVFVWPVLVLNVGALGIVVFKLHQLVLRRSLDVRRLHAGLSGLLFLAVASLAIGVDGFLIELFFCLRRFAAGLSDAALGQWLIGVSSMMIVAMVAAILAALAWFVLARWVARIENREADELLDSAQLPASEPKGEMS